MGTISAHSVVWRVNWHALKSRNQHGARRGTGRHACDLQAGNKFKFRSLRIVCCACPKEYGAAANDVRQANEYVSRCWVKAGFGFVAGLKLVLFLVSGLRLVLVFVVGLKLVLSLFLVVCPFFARSPKLVS